MEIFDTGRSVLRNKYLRFSMVLAIPVILSFTIYGIIFLFSAYIGGLEGLPGLADGILRQIAVAIFIILASSAPLALLMATVPLLVDDEPSNPSPWFGSKEFWTGFPGRLARAIGLVVALELIYILAYLPAIIIFGSSYYVSEGIAGGILVTIGILLFLVSTALSLIIILWSLVLIHTIPAQLFVLKRNLSDVLWCEITSIRDRLSTYGLWVLAFSAVGLITSWISELDTMVAGPISLIGLVVLFWWYCSAFVREVRQLQANQ